ncbi:MAG: 2-amino-4-hydroxy-6-hydroxymethyldihydropteridine diphosphokinase [Pseudomonadota bacterium]|nr:2-amino-4-hydroxy-6-hydroxymethyldihydropteridine diphosphokinase [Pseudomonadota bacterium]
MTKAYIALGSNLDDPVNQVRIALEQIDKWPGIRIEANSPLYKTSPVGYDRQPDFINACARIETGLFPHALLDVLLEIERLHGRQRGIINGPRTLDLDILLYEDLVFSDDRLILPHPRMHERAFVLAPLSDLDAALLIPGFGEVGHLLSISDRSGVKRIEGT